ncbi:MAG: hypothetical protein QXM08_05935 [Thermofilaceae archaeon]
MNHRCRRSVELNLLHAVYTAFLLMPSIVVYWVVSVEADWLSGHLHEVL